MTFDFASIVLTVGYRSAANPGGDNSERKYLIFC